MGPVRVSGANTGSEKAMPPTNRPRLVAVRHGTTEWSQTRRHTGRSDIPLEPEGMTQAVEVGRRLVGHSFCAVLTSPLERARETSALAGFGGQAEICDDLAEWDYGEMEGLTTEEVRVERPGWDIWTDGVVGGETLSEVAGRAQRVVEMVRSAPGDVLVFGHAHMLRIVAAIWIGSDARTARSFTLEPATISVLGWERETPVVLRWNVPAGGAIW
jgi:broad specificity phosphatase PhoE